MSQVLFERVYKGTAIRSIYCLFVRIELNFIVSMEIGTAMQIHHKIHITHARVYYHRNLEASNALL